MTERIEVLHERGHRACGKLALYLTQRVKSGEIMRPEWVEWPDGHEAYSGESVYCHSCHIGIWLLAQEDGSAVAASIIPVLTAEEYAAMCEAHREMGKRIQEHIGHST